MYRLTVRGSHPPIKAKRKAILMAAAKDDAPVSTEVEVSGPRDASNMIASLNEVGAGMFSTIQGGDRATKIQIGRALTTSVPVDEHLNKTINLDNFIIQPVELTDDKTGETNIAPRVTLIDADGTAYHGTSVGLVSSLKNILAVFGQRDAWGEPIPITVVQEKTNRGYRVFTIKFA